jgi:hypothetical protein
LVMAQLEVSFIYDFVNFAAFLEGFDGSLG